MKSIGFFILVPLLFITTSFGYADELKKCPEIDKEHSYDWYTVKCKQCIQKHSSGVSIQTDCIGKGTSYENAIESLKSPPDPFQAGERNPIPYLYIVRDCKVIKKEVKSNRVTAWPFRNEPKNNYGPNTAQWKNVDWSLTHWGTTGGERGVRIFLDWDEQKRLGIDPYCDYMDEISSIRNGILYNQAGNSKNRKRARESIKLLTDEELKNLICAIVLKYESILRKHHFKWVAKHKGKKQNRLREFKRARKRLDTYSIRQTYRDGQSHRRGRKVKLYTDVVRNTTLFELIDNLK